MGKTSWGTMGSPDTHKSAELYQRCPTWDRLGSEQFKEYMDRTQCGMKMPKDLKQFERKIK